MTTVEVAHRAREPAFVEGDAAAHHDDGDLFGARFVARGRGGRAAATDDARVAGRERGAELGPGVGVALDRREAKPALAFPVGAHERAAVAEASLERRLAAGGEATEGVRGLALGGGFDAPACGARGELDGERAGRERRRDGAATFAAKGERDAIDAAGVRALRALDDEGVGLRAGPHAEGTAGLEDVVGAVIDEDAGDLGGRVVAARVGGRLEAFAPAEAGEDVDDGVAAIQAAPRAVGTEGVLARGVEADAVAERERRGRGLGAAEATRLGVRGVGECEGRREREEESRRCLHGGAP